MLVSFAIKLKKKKIKYIFSFKDIYFRFKDITLCEHSMPVLLCLHSHVLFPSTQLQGKKSSTQKKKYTPKDLCYINLFLLLQLYYLYNHNVAIIYNLLIFLFSSFHYIWCHFLIHFYTQKTQENLQIIIIRYKYEQPCQYGITIVYRNYIYTYRPT